jgi:hypothetical protein
MLILKLALCCLFGVPATVLLLVHQVKPWPPVATGDMTESFLCAEMFLITAAFWSFLFWIARRERK